jgi:hypothetical protein
MLIATGQLAEARQRLDAGLQLAEETGMKYYDAELLRLRAHTHHDAQARRADLDAATELGRRQGATVFQLRAAIDGYRMRGQPARAALVEAIDQFPADSTFPELLLARALFD